MVALHSSDGKQGFSLESARHCGTLDRRPVRMGIFQCGISRRQKRSPVKSITGLLFLPLSVFFMLMVGIRVKRKQGRASRKR